MHSNENVNPIIIEDIDKTSLHESRMICVELKPSGRYHPFNKEHTNPDRLDNKEQ